MIFGGNAFTMIVPFGKEYRNARLPEIFEIDAIFGRAISALQQASTSATALRLVPMCQSTPGDTSNPAIYLRVIEISVMMARP
jgi:hypothetical protein